MELKFEYPDGSKFEAKGPADAVEKQRVEFEKQRAEMLSRAAQGGSVFYSPTVSRGDPSRHEGGRLQSVTTNTIASATNANTGSDLVMAAVAQLLLVQRKDVAARHEILEEMKSAKSFYRDSYSGNLSSYLDRLAKGKRLNLVGKETYSLANAERPQFERIISEVA